MTEVKCTHDDCAHEWEYDGDSNHYITCPDCLRKVKLDKAIKARENDEGED